MNLTDKNIIIPFLYLSKLPTLWFKSHFKYFKKPFQVFLSTSLYKIMQEVKLVLKSGTVTVHITSLCLPFEPWNFDIKITYMVHENDYSQE